MCTLRLFQKVTQSNQTNKAALILELAVGFYGLVIPVCNVCGFSAHMVLEGKFFGCVLKHG